jgi:hypothetical protein
VSGRAAKKKADSMDLLLDTICNTFGGVLFIALLVVMLVQTSPAHLDATATNDSELNQQSGFLKRELSSLKADIDRLEAARSGQLRTLAALAPDEVRRLLEDRARQEERKSILQAEELRLNALISAMSTDIVASRDASAKVKANLQKTLSEVERLSNRLRLLKDSKVKELRTPVAKPPGLKAEVALVVQYGRLYVWHRYDAMGNRRGLNTDDFLTTRRSAEGLETTPRPTHGVPVSDAPQSRREISEVLRRFNPARCYPHFVVRPDSFDEFQMVRDVALELGFEYRLTPLEADTSIRDRGGRGGVVQ